MIFCLAVAHVSIFDPPCQTFFIRKSAHEVFFSFLLQSSYLKQIFLYLSVWFFLYQLSFFIHLLIQIYIFLYNSILVLYTIEHIVTLFIDRIVCMWCAAYRYLKCSLKVWLNVLNPKSNFHRKSLDKYFRHCKKYCMIAILK